MQDRRPGEKSSRPSPGQIQLPRIQELESLGRLTRQTLQINIPKDDCDKMNCKPRHEDPAAHVPSEVSSSLQGQASRTGSTSSSQYADGTDPSPTMSSPFRRSSQTTPSSFRHPGDFFDHTGLSPDDAAAAQGLYDLSTGSGSAARSSSNHDDARKQSARDQRMNQSNSVSSWGLPPTLSQNRTLPPLGPPLRENSGSRSIEAPDKRHSSSMRFSSFGSNVNAVELAARNADPGWNIRSSSERNTPSLTPWSAGFTDSLYRGRTSSSQREWPRQRQVQQAPTSLPNVQVNYSLSASASSGTNQLQPLSPREHRPSVVCTQNHDPTEVSRGINSTADLLAPHRSNSYVSRPNESELFPYSQISRPHTGFTPFSGANMPAESSQRSQTPDSAATIAEERTRDGLHDSEWENIEDDVEQERYATRSSRQMAPQRRHNRRTAGEAAKRASRAVARGTTTPAANVEAGSSRATSTGTSTKPPTIHFQCGFNPLCTSQEAPRKVVSHFFGRNKTCTKKLPPQAWIFFCRKHYQRGKYRSTVSQRGNMYYDSQARYIRNQIMKFEDFFKMHFTWKIKLQKALQEELDADNARRVANPNLGNECVNSMDSKERERFDEIREARNIKQRFCGDHKSTDDVYNTLAAMHAACENGRVEKLLAVEFLPENVPDLTPKVTKR